MYSLAGLVIEVMGGASWEELLRTRMLQPMNTTHTELTDPGLQQKELSTSYMENGEKLVALDTSIYTDINAYQSSGGLLTSADDMTHWMYVLLHQGITKQGTRILSEKTIRTMQMAKSLPPINTDNFLYKPENPVTYTDMGYGFAWYTGQYRGYQVVHHPGGLHGFTSLLMFIHDLDLSVFIATNGPGYDQAYKAITTIFYYVTDLIAGLEPWVSSNNACSFVQNWINSVPLWYSPDAFKGKVLADRGWTNTDAYLGSYGNMLAGDIIISKDGHGLSMKLNRLRGRLHRTANDSVLVGQTLGVRQFMSIAVDGTQLYTRLKFLRVDDEGRYHDLLFTFPGDSHEWSFRRGVRFDSDLRADGSDTRVYPDCSESHQDPRTVHEYREGRGEVVRGVRGGGHVQWPCSDQRHVVWVGSMTKAFTVSMLASLMEEDSSSSFTWETPLAAILGADFRLVDVCMTSHVTLADLLTHRTGLRASSWLFFAGFPDNMSLALLEKYFPFETWMYCLAGRVAEIMGGASWEELLGRGLLQPMGMRHTFTFSEAFKLRPYSERPDTRILSCTRILSERSLREMQTALVLVPLDMGIFLYEPQFPVTYTDNGYRIVKHPGVFPGYNSFLGLLPDLDLGIFIAANASAHMDTLQALFYFITDVILGLKPWLTAEDAYHFPEPWINTTKPRVSSDMSEKNQILGESGWINVDAYLGTYGNMFVDDVIISEDRGRGMSMRLNKLQTRLYRTANDDVLMAKPLGTRHFLSVGLNETFFMKLRFREPGGGGRYRELLLEYPSLDTETWSFRRND
ncbi:hypothetical protein ACOMHN_056691 [Nucella lapillus]